MSKEHESDGPQRSGAAARIGRKVGGALFWLLLAYVIGMSAISIIPSLYFPDWGPRPSGASLEACAGDIRSLEADLVERAAEALRQEPSRRSVETFADWDSRFVTIAQDCGALRGARDDLAKLRKELHTLLLDYARGPLHTRERIRRELAAYADQSSRPES